GGSTGRGALTGVSAHPTLATAMTRTRATRIESWTLRATVVLARAAAFRSGTLAACPLSLQGAAFVRFRRRASDAVGAIDPYDPSHVISGLHEADGLVESKDGGNTWTPVGGSGWPTGGIS